MSNNALQAIKQLVVESTATVKIMTVTEVLSDNRLVVMADNDRRVVSGKYELGIELLISGNSILGFVNPDKRTYFIE